MHASTEGHGGGEAGELASCCGQVDACLGRFGGSSGRPVGPSSIGWLGPAASGAGRLGRGWPRTSLRERWAIFSDSPPMDALWAAVALQYRFKLRALARSAGLALRGA